MGEQLEEVGAREALAAESQLAPEQALLPETGRPAVHWLRLIYSLEFLVAVLVVLTLWSEIGGQSHLDMMTWYAKLLCIVGASWCTVRFTAAIVESPSIWNRRALIWFSGLVLVAFTMGALTYYYHLHEESDEDNSDDTQTTALIGAVSPAHSWAVRGSCGVGPEA